MDNTDSQALLKRMEVLEKELQNLRENSILPMGNLNDNDIQKISGNLFKLRNGIYQVVTDEATCFPTRYGTLTVFKTGKVYGFLLYCTTYGELFFRVFSEANVGNEYYNDWTSTQNSSIPEFIKVGRERFFVDGCAENGTEGKYITIPEQENSNYHVIISLECTGVNASDIFYRIVEKSTTQFSIEVLSKRALIRGTVDFYVYINYCAVKAF